MCYGFVVMCVCVCMCVVISLVTQSSNLVFNVLGKGLLSASTYGSATLDMAPIIRQHNGNGNVSCSALTFHMESLVVIIIASST